MEDLIKTNNTQFTVTSVEYTDNVGGDIKPTDGYVFIIVGINIVNKTNTPRFISYSDFYCKNEYTAKQLSDPNTNLGNNYNIFFSTILNSEKGNEFSGHLLFAVRKEIKKHTIFLQKQQDKNPLRQMVGKS